MYLKLKGSVRKNKIKKVIHRIFKTEECVYAFYHKNDQLRWSKYWHCPLTLRFISTSYPGQYISVRRYEHHTVKNTLFYKHILLHS